jgi:hypothetical protein
LLDASVKLVMNGGKLLNEHLLALVFVSNSTFVHLIFIIRLSNSTFVFSYYSFGFSNSTFIISNFTYDLPIPL